MPDRGFCFRLRDGTGHVIHRAMALASHPVKDDRILRIQKEFSKFHYRNVLVCTIRAVSFREHQCPAGLENRIICDGVCPVMIGWEDSAGGPEVAVGKTYRILYFFPVIRELPDKAFPFKILNRHRYR